MHTYHFIMSRRTINSIALFSSVISLVILFVEKWYILTSNVLSLPSIYRMTVTFACNIIAPLTCPMIVYVIYIALQCMYINARTFTTT